MDSKHASECFRVVAEGLAVEVDSPYVALRNAAKALLALGPETLQFARDELAKNQGFVPGDMWVDDAKLDGWENGDREKACEFLRQTPGVPVGFQAILQTKELIVHHTSRVRFSTT